MTRPVPVTFDYSEEGSVVELAGSFNNWSRVAMEGGPKEWSITLELLPGQYQYKFIVDNEWTHHQGKPTTKDSTGKLNNVIVVEENQDQQSKEVRDLKAALMYALESEKIGDGETALVRAISQGNVEIATTLLSAGAEINMLENSPSRKTALFCAASQGYTELAKMIVERGKSEPLQTEIRYIEICTHEGFTPLMAAAGGHTEIFKLLMDNEAELDKQNNAGDTALIIAAHSGGADICKLLIEKTAEVDKQNDNGDTALLKAAKSGQADICEMLLVAGADINKRNNGYYGETAVDIAKEKNDCKLLEIFEKYNDSIIPLQLAEVLKRHELSEEDMDKVHYKVRATPLCYAAANGKNEACKLLIEARADVNKEYEGMTALNAAAKNGHADICQMLVEAGADVQIECADTNHHRWECDKPDHECYAPLMNAIKFSGNADVVNVLIKAGADLSKQTRDGQTALCLAARYNHLDIIKVLLLEGVEVDLTPEGSRGWTALMAAAEEGNTEICKLLMDKGAELDKQNDNGDTALIKAAEKGKANICDIILLAGADINKRNYDCYGKTAMDIAKEKNNSEVIDVLEKYRDSIIPLQLTEVLKKHGLSEDNLDQEDNDGNIALLYAAAIGKYEACKLLIEAGADVNKMSDRNPTRRDQTALNLAALNGFADICQMLTDAGAEVDPMCQDTRNNRMTPLMQVIGADGNINIVNLLIKMGANLNACDGEGKTPLYLATENRHPDVVKALIKAGADMNMANTIGNTPLINSVWKTTEICQLLLEGGANVNLWNTYGMTALNEAVTYRTDIADFCQILLDGGASLEYHENALPPLANAIKNNSNGEIVKMLIKAGSDVNMKIGKIPLLYYAIDRKECHTDAVEILIEAGADMNVIYWGETPLGRAIYHSHKEIIQLLIKAGAELDKENGEGWTALGLVAKYGKYDKLFEYITYSQELIKAGANTEKAWEKCRTDDHYMFLAANEVKVLVLESGTDFNMQKHFPTGKTALFYASARGKEAQVWVITEKLKEAYAEKNRDGTTPKADAATAYIQICTNEGWTPLMAAAKGGYTEICKTLMNIGIELEKQNYNGDTALIIAAESRQKDVCEILLAAGAEFNKQNNNGDTALMKAVESRQEDVCQIFLAAGADLNKQNDKGDTALIKAVECGHWDIHKMLIVAGANLDKQNINGDTALIKAAKYPWAEICETLLTAGADINKRNYDYYGDTALDIAKENQYSRVVEELEKYSDSILPLQLDDVLKKHNISENNIDEITKDGHTELHYAASNRKIEACKLLIEAGANINIMHGGETALNSAAKNGYADICEILIEAGADVDTEHQDNFTPLMNAIKVSGSNEMSIDVVNILIKAGADVNRQTKDGQSPLFLAYTTDIAELLISGGAEVDMTPAGSQGWTPLMAAADQNNVDMCRFLLDKGAQADKQNDNGDTALIIAAEADYNYHYSVCEVLLEAMADINKQNHDGDTALIKLVRDWPSTFCEMLLGAGADIDKKNNDGKTAMDINMDKETTTVVEKYRDLIIPLHLAAENGNFEACKTLIEEEEYSEHFINKLYKYQTPLYVAAIKGHAHICQMLLDAGAYVNRRSFDWDWEINNSWSPLMGVIKKDGNMDIINLFIKMGADLDEQNKFDSPPLCLAARHNHPNVVKVLIEGGADVNISPDLCKFKAITPLIESVLADAPEICQLLLEAGAEVDKEDMEGWSALVYAVKQNIENIGKMLINAGADIEKARKICDTEEELKFLENLNLK